MRKIAYFFLILAACGGPGKDGESSEQTTGLNKYKDPVMRTIYQARDKRDAEALQKWFDHENWQYREEAAKALISFQDSASVIKLATLLEDKNAEVRAAAVKALGQSRRKEALTSLFVAFRRESLTKIKGLILESIGKCSGFDAVAFLSKLNPDTLGKEEATGLAYGLYYAAVGSFVQPAGTEVIFKFLENEKQPYFARIIAAHYLGRTRTLDLTTYSDRLIKLIQAKPQVEILAQLIYSIRHCKTKASEQQLITMMDVLVDPRVRLSAIKAIKPQNAKAQKKTILAGLGDIHRQVRVTTAQELRRLGEPSYLQNVLDTARQEKIWNPKTELYKTALFLANKTTGKTGLKNAIISEIQQGFEQAKTLQEKGGWISAMSQDVLFLDFLGNLSTNATEPVVRGHAGQAIAEMANSKIEITADEQVYKKLFQLFRQMLETGDIAQVAAASAVFANPAHDWHPYETELVAALNKAKERMKMPQDVEMLREIHRALKYWRGAEAGPVPTPKYNNPPDWDHIRNISPTQEVRITTHNGSIVVRMNVEDAPISVSQFIKLTEEGFYDGKVFHRVVPNFVIQGGCPRGDGWGSMDKTLRSELDGKYVAGTMGLASAGNDTESCQWFITHSFTPHLDGRYTVLGNQTAGRKEVLHIDIGDTIRKVELIPQGAPPS